MSKAIFSDSDLTVKLEPVPGKGVKVSLMCQSCELPYILIHPWAEVRLMLEGKPVAGVVMMEDGFEVQFQCSNTSDGCTQVNKYRITHEELERMAESEVRRKQRLQGGGQPQQQRQGPPRR